MGAFAGRGIGFALARYLVGRKYDELLSSLGSGEVCFTYLGDNAGLVITTRHMNLLRALGPSAAIPLAKITEAKVFRPAIPFVPRSLLVRWRDGTHPRQTSIVIRRNAGKEVLARLQHLLWASDASPNAVDISYSFGWGKLAFHVLLFFLLAFGAVLFFTGYVPAALILGGAAGAFMALIGLLN